MMDPRAKWIAAAAVRGLPSPGDRNAPAGPEPAAPLFRREFVLPAAPKRAVLSVCGLGYGVFTLNGEPVTQDVLTTPFTRFDATVLYNTCDVTELLHAGANAAGALLGNGWYNDVGAVWDYDRAPWRNYPRLIFSLTAELENGGTVTVVSDAAWKSADGPVTYNHIRCGERYDARLEKPGFDRPGFDDSGWQPAFVCRGPGGRLAENRWPNVRVTDTLPMVRLAPNLFDARQNLSGWVRLRVRGERGQKITLRYSERLAPGGGLDTENINAFNRGAELRHCDEYICAGGGPEEWEPRFCYHGFRYVEVLGGPCGLELSARVVHTDLASVGTFECSDGMLNRIHAASRWSTLTNFCSIPTDCPHREQNGWTGDAALSCEQALMNFDMTPAYEKWLNDFRDVQRPNGAVPGVVPTGGWGFNWGSGPAWDAALILIPLYVWRYTQNDLLLRNMWDCMERYLGFLGTMEQDGLLDFGLGDWCAPRTAKMCPAGLTDTACYYVFACAMAEGAGVLKKDPAPYRALAARVRAAFRARYVQNGLPVPEGQTSLACVLTQGLLEPGEEAAAAARLAALAEQNGFHIDCGILGNKYIYRALSDRGYGEVLYKMVTNPTPPSYAWWIHSGMTTLCEDWEMENSLNHNMFSEVDLWFYRSLAGIRRDEKELVIEPVFLPELDWVRASHGGIRVEWNRETVTVTVPEPAVLVLGGRRLPLRPGTTAVSR